MFSVVASFMVIIIIHYHYLGRNSVPGTVGSPLYVLSTSLGLHNERKTASPHLQSSDSSNNSQQ